MATPLSRWSIAAVGLALAAVGASWSLGGGAMFSPGALHAGDSVAAPLGGVPSHAALGGRCGACHVAPWSGATMAGQCLSCHTDVQAELGDTSALHGALSNARGCVSCHTEHRGARGSLTRVDAGGLAHDQLGFALAAHRETAGGGAFACSDCHAAETFRFDRARCESCHREYQPAFVLEHTTRWGSDCLACHDGRDRFSRGAFDHDTARFALTGAHGAAACVDCHEGVRTLGGYGRAPVDCIGCHRKDDEHRGEFGAGCGDCHTTRTWEGARFDHEFPLNHGGERKIACSTCHEDRTNYKSYTCYGCHEHSPARISAEHAEEGIVRDLSSCARCHPTGREHEGGRGEGGRGERRRHGREHDS